MSRKKRKKPPAAKNRLILVVECTHSRRVRGPVVSHCYECGAVAPEDIFAPPAAPEAPPSTEATSMQLAALDDDGAPPWDLPDTGNYPEGTAIEEGVPPSSGWRTREYTSSVSHLPVILTTWEP